MQYIKKLLFFAAPVLIVLILWGCGFLGSLGFDEDQIPPVFEPDTTSAFFTAEPISFSGDPAADFGAERLWHSNPSNDVVLYPDGGAAGDELRPVADIRDVYVAFSSNALFIGAEMPDVDPADFSPYKMAFLLFIDNNVEGSIGISDFSDNSELLTEGLSVTWGFDNPGTEFLAGQASFYLKHWRESGGVQWISYYFWNGSGSASNPVAAGAPTSQLTVYPPNNTASAVTEVGIPWLYIYGDEVMEAGTQPDDINIFIITSPTLAATGFVDRAPGSPTTDKWNEVETAGEWGTLQIQQ